MKRNLLTLLSLVIFFVGCSEKEFDPADPKKSFGIAKEPYDDENYEIALTRLGEYKSRFPYSVYAVEAELLIANSYFSLSKFGEAAASYEQFVKLHPRHGLADFAQFRVGESYWQDAPEEVNREQDYAARSVAEWQKLLDRYPKSSYADKAKDLIAIGTRRIAESMEFIADFYCRKEVWQACAYTFIKLAETYPQFKDLVKKSYDKAADCFELLSSQKAEDKESDKNIYFKTMSAEEIRAKASEFRKKASSV